MPFKTHIVLTALLLFSLFLADVFTPVCTSALELSRNLPTTARDLEFFYVHQKAETIPGLLRSLDTHGRFRQGEIRLVTAAFLAEILSLYPEQAQDLLKLADSLSPDAQRMYLWAVHLTGEKGYQKALQHLPASQDKALALQLAHSPEKLSHWDITRSSAVLYMYWGAYFASKSLDYLDPIIDCSLIQAKLKARGLVQDPRYQGSMAAAASLYEMAARHESVRQRLKQRSQSLNGPEKATVDLMLKAHK